MFVYLTPGGDPVTEAVTIGSSCSSVVVLPCGSRLLGGDSVERPTLTWRKNGENLTPQNSDSEVSQLRYLWVVFTSVVVLLTIV